MKKVYLAHLPLFAFLAMILLGGFGAIGVHFTDLEIPPFWGAAIRIAPASLLLFLLVFIRKLPMPRGKALLGAVLFGALDFGGSYAFIYYGLEEVKPGMSMVILALVPVFSMFFAIAHRQETFRWRLLLGSLLAVGGIAIVFHEQLQIHVPFSALLALVLGAACISESSVIVKSFPQCHPVTTNAIGLAAGAAVLFLMSALWHESHVLPVKSATWAALLYLIFIGTCAVFILFLYVLKTWRASVIAYQFVLLPFVTFTASAWMTGETLTPTLMLGAALVMAGIYFGVLAPRLKQKSEQPAPDIG